MNIKHFLDEQHVPYRVYDHKRTYDAQRFAATLRVPGRNVAKTVLLRAAGSFRYCVVVLPACERVNLDLVSRLIGGAPMHLATESEMAIRCPDCEFGILPPFGSQFHAETIIDDSLTRHEDIIFQGDTHTEAIRMKYRDFQSIEHPLVASNTCLPVRQEAPDKLDAPPTHAS